MTKKIYFEDVMASICTEFPHHAIYATDHYEDIDRVRTVVGNAGIITCGTGLPVDMCYAEQCITCSGDVIYWVHAKDEYCLSLVDRLLFELGYDVDFQPCISSAAA